MSFRFLIDQRLLGIIICNMKQFSITLLSRLTLWYSQEEEFLKILESYSMWMVDDFNVTKGYTLKFSEFEQNQNMYNILI
jgi:hypothetical protein